MSFISKHIRLFPVVIGTGMIAFGTASILRPQSTVNLFSLFVGIVAFIMGTIELVLTVRPGADVPEYIPGMLRLRGVVNVIIGIVFLLNRTTSAIFAGAALGVWGVTFGSIRVHDSLCRRAEGRPWRTPLADGILRCVIGAVVLIGPLFGREAWVLTLGLFFIAMGISVIVSALFLDSRSHVQKSASSEKE